MNRALAWLSLAALAATAGCTSSNPSQPTATAPAAAVDATASIAAPRPLTPANNAQIRNADQPVILVVRNAITTATSAITYTFEVAGDAAFANKVQTRDNVAEGSGGGQTTVTLDALPAAKDYWWHARATGGGTTGVFGIAYKFTVGPAITIDAPVPIGPLNGQTTEPRPALRVRNATRTGPAGAITYRFEISTASTFPSVVATGTNVEGVNETGFIPAADLPLDTLLYWRAYAIDAANGVTSAPSAVQSFTPHRTSQAEVVAAQLGVTLWPGQQPPGTVGHATMGSFWNVEYVTSFDGVRFLNPPLDQVQIFDLLDRGLGPQAAIDWMNSHGYRTAAAYYPSVQVIGFQFEYMAFINGVWDIVLKVGA